MSVSVEPLEPALRSGRVASVHGSVVDIAFAGGMLPALNEAVAIEWDLGQPLVAEVQQHLGPAMVRVVALGRHRGAAAQCGRPRPRHADPRAGWRRRAWAAAQCDRRASGPRAPPTCGRRASPDPRTSARARPPKRRTRNARSQRRYAETMAAAIGSALLLMPESDIRWSSTSSPRAWLPLITRAVLLQVRDFSHVSSGESCGAPRGGAEGWGLAPANPE